MSYLFSHWPSLARTLRKAPGHLLLFDYDGTLTPIQPTPRQARLQRSIRNLLRMLSRCRGVTVGVVSGRGLKQLQRLVGLPGLVYMGNHGLEIEGGRFRFIHPRARARAPLLSRLANTLRRRLRRLKGALVENKTLTLSVHYRRVHRQDLARLKKIVTEVLASIGLHRGLEVRRGKEVIEIRPDAHWDKGSAILLLRRQLPASVVTLYVGDDTTDEDAFHALRSQGMTVRVGRKQGSWASYYLKRQGEVQELLQRLVVV